MAKNIGRYFFNCGISLHDLYGTFVVIVPREKTVDIRRKIVLKNNDAVCVLVKPERYDEMVKALEDYALYCEAERRSKAADSSTIPLAQMMDEFKITKEDLDAVEVEIE